MNWETRDGQSIPIDKLDDSHLVNIIRMLRRKSWRFVNLWAWRALSYAADAPDGAAMAAESWANQLLDGDIETIDGLLGDESPMFAELLEESDRRKLRP